jgi:hypothetical protein
MRPARAIVRHWHLVMLAYTFSLLVGAVPALPPSPAGTADGGKIRANQLAGSQRHRVRGAGHPRGLEPGMTTSAEVAVPVGRWGAAAAELEALVEQLPTARTGRTPRPRRPLPPT